MVTTSLPATAERLLSRIEAASYLGVSAATLNTWASTGRGNLPYVKVGRLAKYRLADLQAWLAARTATHTGEHEALAAAAS